VPELARISVDEAAARLGVCARTVRNRLRRGELNGEKVSTRSGAEWQVEWDERAPESGEELRARNLELAGENERLRAELAELRAALPSGEKERRWWRK